MNILKIIPFFIFSLSYAYEKIDFIGQISDQQAASAVSVVKYEDKTYVLSLAQVFVYDSSFSQISKISLKPGVYSAIALGENRVYVLDRENAGVQAYSISGEYLFTFASKGPKNGQLSDPSDIKYFSGKIYAANKGSNRIEIFDKEGIYFYGFNLISKDGLKKISPSKIALDRSGFIYVCDSSLGIVQKYDYSGRLLNEKNIQASALAVNSKGIIYSANEKDGKIKELDRDLSEISSFGTKGKGKFEFLSFADLETDEQDRLVAADPKNRKIMILELENSKYESPLAQSESYDFLRFEPGETYQVSAFSFSPLEKGIVYYDLKAKKTYSLSEGLKKDFIPYGETEGAVREPADMVFYNGKIYISDTGNSRAQIFSAEGKYDSFFGGKTGFLEKSKEGKFSSPSSVACDSKGKIYVADSATSLVQAFSKDGIFLFTVGPDIGGTKLLKISDIKTDDENKLYILDSELKKVFTADSNGKYISSWSVSSLSKPVSFAYDKKGYFYFLDKENSNVAVYDKNGNYLASFFAKGKGIREFYEPVSLKISKGKLYISDPVNSKIVSYSLFYAPPKPQNLSVSASQEDISLSWSLSNPNLSEKFEIYRGESADKMEKIEDVKSATYKDSRLQSSSTYYYKVASVSGNDKSYSDTVSVYFKGKEPAVQEIKLETQEDIKNKPPVEIIPVELNYIFSANYKYYMENPIGKILVKNNTEEKFSNIKVSFFLKDYMDFPSDIILPALDAKTSSYAELKATLNNKILTINEDTPVQAQITVSYYRDGQEKENKINKPVKILSKNAITWDNTERIANFITVKDTPVYAFSRAILSQKTKFAEFKNLDDNVIMAAVIWHNLSEYPITYIADPSNPYSSVKGSAEFITDTVQFPRNTLKLKSGDCDDLTVLISTLLESAGASVKILDYPGHIALMFETQAEDISEVGLPDNLIIKQDNKYYVPVETTMLGKSFYDSVSYAAQMYKNAQDNVKVVDLKKAMSKFEPVTLPDMSEEFPLPADTFEKIKSELKDISDKKFEFYEKTYKEGLKANPEDMSAYVNLGVLYSGYGKLEEAEKIFKQLLEKDEANPAALNNMGNVYYVKKEYAKAAQYYEKAAKLDPFDENIFLNAARAYLKLGKKEEASIFAQKAVQINPQSKSLADSLFK